jgi:hypothetical protein
MFPRKYGSVKLTTCLSDVSLQESIAESIDILDGNDSQNNFTDGEWKIIIGRIKRILS